MFAYYARLAVRSFRRNKVLTALMVVAIALGIGASMTTLTVFHVLSGDPIPGKSDRLFYVQLDAATARVVALDDHRDRTDRDALLAALHATGGNVSACAQRLRISRMTVYRLCRKHRVELQQLR